MGAWLQSILVQIYCADMTDLTVWGLLLTILFLMGYRRCQHNLWCKVMLGAVLLCCTAVVIYATVGNRGGGHEVRLNLIPFHSYRAVQAGATPELYRSNFMNVALFYPVGLLATVLLPEKWPGWCKVVLVVVLLMAISAGVEYAQYSYALGDCEIDDVIHNTAGALTGSLAVVLFPMLEAFARKHF